MSPAVAPILRAVGSIPLAGGDAIGVDLTVAPGELVSLVGPNGVGKSATLAALLGLAPFEGTVLLADRDITAEPAHRRGLAWAPQHPALLPRGRAVAQVARYARSGGPLATAFGATKPRALAAAVLTALGIDAADRRRPSQLSGGEAQRVSVARALVAGSVVLLDEPTSMQDQQGADRIRTLLHAYRRAGGAAVVVAHLPQDAYLLSDRLTVLEGGAVVQTGTPQDLARDPATPYVARIVGATVLEGDVRDGVLGGPWGELTVHDAAADGPAQAILRPGAIGVSRLEPSGSSRNVLQLTVRAIQATADVVAIDLAGPPNLVAHVTRAAADALALQPGDRVWASIKANDIALHGA